MTYTITDRITGATVSGVDRYDIAETLRSQNPGAPAEVLQVIDSLAAKLLAGDYYGDEETYLQAKVEADEPRPILTPVEVSALRVAMGLSMDELAAALRVNPRTVRSWESGRDRLSPSSSAAVWALLAEHDAQADAYALELPDRVPDGPRPRRWYLAALGRAMCG